MKAYVSENVEKSAEEKDKMFFESLQSALMIEGSTSAFYKGVLEWLLAKKAYEKELQRGTEMIKVKYVEVLQETE